jgi:pilus assembly protein CpaF
VSLLQKKLEEQRKQAERSESPSKIQSSSKHSRSDEITSKVLEGAIEEIDLSAVEKMAESDRDKHIRQQVTKLVEKVTTEQEVKINRSEQLRITDEVTNEITGYGPITSLLSDDTITEIMVNGPNSVYIERKGKLELTDVKFRNDSHLMNIIERIVSPLGKRIDESSPTVDARLPDGSRVNAVIPPVSLDGSTLTIRKFSKTPFTMSDLIRFGSVSANMGLFIQSCVKGKLNVVVGGGTGSGKTTTLNVLSSFIPNDERIVTIEDAAELKLMQDHVIRLESRPANIEGKGAIKIRDLVINSLRMRPDRIVVGEVRSGEALDMLQAMNTGHDGSLTTGHANSPRDLLSRLETMVLMAGVDLPIKAIREQVASAINLIVYQSRMRDGTRKITKISEITGMEGDIITLQDIFIFDQQGIGDNGKVIGNFRPTGIIPKCLPVLETRGIHLPVNIFS